MECIVNLFLASGRGHPFLLRFLQSMKSLLLIVIMLLVAACQPDNAQPSELDTKSAYSVLQSYEFKWRDKPHSSGIVVVRSALGTKFDIVGLPIAGKNKGFVWLVLNPMKPDEQGQFVRVPADLPVTVTDSDLKSIEEKVELSPQARSVLLRMMD